MRVYLDGHLSWYDAQKRSWLEITQPAPFSLVELARFLGVPASEIAVVTVNGVAVDLETSLAAEGDTVAFYAPVGGG